MKNFDVIIIGGGPAGITSALIAAKSGKKIFFVDLETQSLNLSVCLLEYLSFKLGIETTYLLFGFIFELSQF